MPDQEIEQQRLDTLEGVAEVDKTAWKTRGGKKGQDTRRDTGAIGINNEATTVDGGIAIDGGKLPGNHDDFERELGEGRRAVPGADKKHRPAHAMSKGETKHLGI